MLWCSGATFHYEQKEDAGIHLLGGLSADMGVFLLTGFFTLFTGTTEGREAVCGEPMNPHSVSARASETVAPFY